MVQSRHNTRTELYIITAGNVHEGCTRVLIAMRVVLVLQLSLDGDKGCLESVVRDTASKERHWLCFISIELDLSKKSLQATIIWLAASAKELTMRIYCQHKQSTQYPGPNEIAKP